MVQLQVPESSQSFILQKTQGEGALQSQMSPDSDRSVIEQKTTKKRKSLESRSRSPYSQIVALSKF